MVQCGLMDFYVSLCENKTCRHDLAIWFILYMGMCVTACLSYAKVLKTAVRGTYFMHMSETAN